MWLGFYFYFLDFLSFNFYFKIFPTFHPHGKIFIHNLDDIFPSMLVVKHGLLIVWLGYFSNSQPKIIHQTPYPYDYKIFKHQTPYD
jgi:hypothetical protein